MPASLTNQIRLGFSLGWRIWTPNEVGFYARSLAHSYFINNVLTTKFLEKKIWIVNYTIFIGSKKYYVFLEYLQFGVKSKEERCYWKKLIYMTAEWGFNDRSGASRKVSKALKYYRYFSKMESARRSEKQRYPATYSNLRESVKDWVCATVTDILSKNPKIYNVDSAVEAISSRLTYSKLNTISGFYTPFNAFYNLRGEPILANTSVKTNYVMNDWLLSDKLSKNHSTTKDSWVYRNAIISTSSNLQFKLPKKNIQSMSNIGLEPLVRYSKSTPLACIWRYDANVTHNSVIKTPELLFNDFRGIFDSNKSKILTPEPLYSFFVSGPRMRYFRNLRRSHQSRHVYKYASLIWHWEKLARLVSFHAKYHGGLMLFSA